MLSKIISPVILNNYIDFWLQEDIPNFDLSTLAADSEEETEARIDLKEDGVLAGFPFCEAVAKKFNCRIEWKYVEGEFVKSRAVVGIVKGKINEILMSERTILNVLCRASGVATLAKHISGLIDVKWKGELVGTRKTTPGFRMVEKYAMYIGGIGAHRYDLSSMVMLKDNHIKASGNSIEMSIQNVRKVAGNNFMKIEVEVSSLTDAITAAKYGADIIMLDNMNPNEIRDVAKQIKNINKSVLVEVSGGITESNIKNYAVENVDIISSSMFCQGYKCIDLSMNFFSDEEKVNENGLELLSASNGTGSNQTSINSPQKATLVANRNTISNKSPAVLSNTAKNVFTKPKPDLKRKAEESPELKKATNEPEAKLDRTDNTESTVPPVSKPAIKSPSTTPSKIITPTSSKIISPSVKVTTPTLAKITTPTSAKITTPTSAKITAPTPTKITTPTSAKITTPTSAKITTPTSAKITTPTSAKITTPTLAKITTPTSAKITTPASAKTATPTATKITQHTVVSSKTRNISAPNRGRGGIFKQQKAQGHLLNVSQSNDKQQLNLNHLQQKLMSNYDTYPQPKQVQVGMPVRLASPNVQRNNNMMMMNKQNNQGLNNNNNNNNNQGFNNNNNNQGFNNNNNFNNNFNNNKFNNKNFNNFNNNNNNNNMRGVSVNYQRTLQNNQFVQSSSGLPLMNPMRYGGSIQSAGLLSSSAAANLMRPDLDKYFCRRCRFQNELGGPPNCAKCQFSLI